MTTRPSPTGRAPDGNAVLAYARREAAPLRKRLETGSTVPRLVAVSVGRHPVVEEQVRRHAAEAPAWGISFTYEALPREADEARLRRLLRSLTRPRSTAPQGVVLLRPLPGELSLARARHEITPRQDVEGVHPETRGRAWGGSPWLPPAAGAAVLLILDTAGVAIAGREVVLVAPASTEIATALPLLLARGAAVTHAPPSLPDPAALARRADVLLVEGVGPLAVGATWIRPGAFVLDAGVHAAAPEAGASPIVGDVDAASVRGTGATVTPVPGALAAATMAAVLRNTLVAALSPDPDQGGTALPLFDRSGVTRTGGGLEALRPAVRSAACQAESRTTPGSGCRTRSGTRPRGRSRP